MPTPGRTRQQLPPQKKTPHPKKTFFVRRWILWFNASNSTVRTVAVMVKKKKKFVIGDAVRFLNAAKGKMDVGVIKSIGEDGKFVLALATGGRKTGIEKNDIQKASKHDISNRKNECHGMTTHKDAYVDLHTANTMDKKTKKALTVDPKDQHDYPQGTPVSFTYEVPHGLGGMIGKSAVGTVHSRQIDGTYSIDLMNGARKANICDAKKCDPKLLDEELQNESGMVTHKDAYAGLHTANAVDEKTKRRFSNAVDPRHQKEMPAGTPVSFMYEVPNAAGGTVGKHAVGKVHNRQADGTYTIDLMNGARKANIMDAKECDPKLLITESQSEAGMVTHKDALEYLHTSNAVDDTTKRRFSNAVDPRNQKEMSAGTPVSFTYEVPNAAGGMVRKNCVGKVHNRQDDGTYTIDLLNGARKANIIDAKECDAKLLEEEYQSEHGMVTHKDALEYLHTANAMDDVTRRRFSSNPMDQAGMAAGTPVSFSYEVPNSAGGSVKKDAVGKVHNRQADGTYTIDLMNGTRKTDIYNAMKCDAKLLEEEYQSEHGMVTHKDAYTDLHTANAEEQPVVQGSRRPSSATRQRIEEAKGLDQEINASQ
jgi:hypothetical protein